MMEQKHTKEPLRIAETRATDIVIRNANQDPVALVYTAGWDKTTARATARRLVSCYNACAGMDDPAKEITVLKRQVGAGEALRFELATLCDLLDLDSTAKINRNWQLQVRKHLAAWDAAKEGSHE